MVDRLRGAPLLRYRGRPLVDEAALVNVIVAVAGVVAIRPDLRSRSQPGAGDPGRRHRASTCTSRRRRAPRDRDHRRRDPWCAASPSHGVETVFGIPGTPRSGDLPASRRLRDPARDAAPRAGCRLRGRRLRPDHPDAPAVVLTTTGPAALNVAAAVGQAYSTRFRCSSCAGNAGGPSGARHRMLHEMRDQRGAFAGDHGAQPAGGQPRRADGGGGAGVRRHGGGPAPPAYLEVPLDLIGERPRCRSWTRFRVTRRQPDRQPWPRRRGCSPGPTSRHPARRRGPAGGRTRPGPGRGAGGAGAHHHERQGHPARGPPALGRRRAAPAARQRWWPSSTCCSPWAPSCADGLVARSTGGPTSSSGSTSDSGQLEVNARPELAIGADAASTLDALAAALYPSPKESDHARTLRSRLRARPGPRARAGCPQWTHWPPC